MSNEEKALVRRSAGNSLPASVQRSLAIMRGEPVPAEPRIVPVQRTPVETAVAILSEVEKLQSLPSCVGMTATRLKQGGQPARVDCVRVCAYHNLPWAAVYLLERDGSYRYSDSIQIRKRLYMSRYIPGERQVYFMDSCWITEEECAHCGAYGFSWHCTECDMLVCHGRSSGNYLRCRTRCGMEGHMVPGPVSDVGIVP